MPVDPGRRANGPRYRSPEHRIVTRSPRRTDARQDLDPGEGGSLEFDAGSHVDLVAERQRVLPEDVEDPQAPLFRVEVERVQVVYERVLGRARAGTDHEFMRAGRGIVLELTIERFQPVPHQHGAPAVFVVIGPKAQRRRVPGLPRPVR